MLKRELAEKNKTLLAAQREISIRKAAEECTQAKLNDAIVVHRATFELAAIGIAHLTLEGRWIRINPFLCDMLGYSAEELQTKTFQDVTYRDDLPTALSLVQALIDGKIPSYAMEKRYIRKDGTVVWGHLSVSLVRDDAGNPKYFISIVKNIDRRVRANAEVERGRARLKAILDSLSEGVIVFSPKGEVMEVNPAAMELFGYENKDEVNSDHTALDATFEVFQLDGSPVLAEQWPVSKLLRGEPVSGEELIIRKKGSNKTWIANLTGSVVGDDFDGSSLAVLTVHDVTQRRMAETALRVSEERLRLAFDNIPDMVVIYDSSLRIQYANLATQQNTQMSAADLIGRTDVEIRPQTMTVLWRPLLNAALWSATIQSDDVDFTEGTGLRNLAVTCVPICEASGKVREVMAICHDYTERRQSQERIRLAALHDPLTGLPNRALLFEYAPHILAAAKRAHSEVCVIFLDLDRFKPINDLYGHETGDAVLREVAHRLRQSMRGDDTIFRLGGDEFLILLQNCMDKSAAEYVARHLLETLSRPYTVGPLELFLSCSIGLSRYPFDGSNIDTLINCADAAMYLAKETGRNSFQFYTAALSERVLSQSALEQEIKEALAHGEFCLHYQPLIDMQTNEVVSVEALLRWPRNGIGPERFIQIAEATGLIGRLGEWVMTEACRQHTDWKNCGLPSIPIAVNVSSIQFQKKDFEVYLDDAIERHKIDPTAIQIELTETAVMEDINHAINVLGYFRKKGMKVSLDDFGTGYSSLNYLSRLPLDKIKIDKSFVHRLEDDNASRAITEAIIALGRTLDLEIVAEGIESHSVLGYLREHGCHQAQGYYVCRPLVGADFVAWYQSFSGAKMHH